MTTQTMMPPQRNTASAVDQAAQDSPFVTEFFMVQALGFRGMAYLDNEGKWHRAFNNAELFGQVKILE